jgi:hypothetical protein
MDGGDENQGESMNVDLQKSDAARAWDAVEEMFPAMPAKPNDKMTLIERESVTNYRYNFLADRAKIILKYFTVERATERINELVIALNAVHADYLEARKACAARDGVINELNAIIERSLGKELSALRLAQDLAHGGPEHDDTHTPVEWRVFIQIYNNQGEQYATEPEIRESKLLAVAGLAVAAIQSSRRKRNA